MKTKILVVEDEPFFRKLVEASLEKEYGIFFEGTVTSAIHRLQKEKFNLIILDIILPDGSGLDICSYIKTQESLKTIPILMLSAKSEVHDKVNGLDYGADDYLAKPFHPKELNARVRAQLRRLNTNVEQQVFMALEYTIDFNKHRVFDPEGSSLDLTHIEYKLLVYFLKHVDHILSRQQLLNAIWTDNLNVTERVVDTHLSNLRKKLGPLGKLIKAVHGSGYTFSYPVSEIAS